MSRSSEMFKSGFLYHLTEKRKMRPETLGSAHIGVQLTAGWKQLVNIILIGIDLLPCECTVMPKSGDHAQPMREERCFFPVNRRLPACRLLSVHLLALRDLWHTRSRQSLTPLNNAGRIRHLPVSLSVCLSLSLSFPDRNHNRSCQNSPGGFRFTYWTSVNQMSTVSSPPTFRHPRWSKWEVKRSRWQQAAWCDRSSRQVWTRLTFFLQVSALFSLYLCIIPKFNTL